MADALAIMRAGGLVDPAPIIPAAAAVGYDLAGAAALFQKETRAQAIWGHDRVDTGGAYTPGGPVTRENYRAYRRSPTAGWQGVGHGQLTYRGFILQAEKLHPDGAADPPTNCRVSLQALKDEQRQHGEQDGARAYNGSNAAAQAYGRDWIVKRNEWRRRFQGATVSAPPLQPRLARPNLRPGATGPLVGALQRFLNDRFPGYKTTPIPILNPPLFGPGTGGAVVEFQGRCRPPIPTGGTPEVGPRTWAALEREGFRG